MENSHTIKVLIIDDSAIVRQTLTELLSSFGDIKVIGVASDPIVASKKMALEMPDVITLDIEMPNMDGLTFLEKVMSQKPIPIIICSSLAESGSDVAIRALELGAVEIITKPKIGTKQFLEESKIRIHDAVKAAYMSKHVKRFVPRIEVAPKLSADVILPPKSPAPFFETTEKVIVIGISTGGPDALRVLLSALPPDTPGIVVVQHMPENFTKAFARRLDSICKVSVKEAEDGDSVIRGRVLIAPGNYHMLLKRSGTKYFVEVKEGPLVSRHRPSADVLFRSAARYAGKNAVGVIMTGMGDDGAKGMLEMKQNGAVTIAQDEKSCVVFGMPNEAIKLGAVDKVLSLENIAGALLNICQ